MARRPDPAKPAREEVVLTLHPSWKGMLGWYIKRLLVSTFVALIAVAAWRSDHLAAYWMVLCVLVAYAVPVGIGRLIRQATTYRITTRRVSETSGILNKKTESAFFTEITNTTVEQNLLERALRIGRIDFDTAGERMSRELRNGNQENFLAWWGLANPHSIEAVVDGLRFGDDHDDQDRRADRDDHGADRDADFDD